MADVGPAPSGHDAVLALPSGTYVVDPQQSEVRFRAKAFGLIWVRGSIPVVEGSLRIADGRIDGRGELAADGIDTGMRPRDWHLRTSHYLDTARHPRIQVTATDASLSDNGVACVLTVKGASGEILVHIRDVERDGGTLRLDATVSLDRTPYPMLPPLAGVSRAVDVEIAVVAKATDVPPAL